MNDGLLTEAHLRQMLGARPFQFYPQVESTNDIAQKWATDGVPTGAVVITEEQTQGRGRFQRSWLAPAGTALLMSIILRPRLAPEHLSRITMLGAVAVAETLQDYAPDQVTIKWPNDVHLAGRKVCGILPEATWQANQLSAVILGIGLNISIDFSSSPLADKAISLQMITGTVVDRAELLHKLLTRIDYWSMRIDDSDLFGAWRTRLNTLAEHVTASFIEGEAGQISGQAVDVDPDGALLLKDANGKIHRLIAGEVSLS